jgi:hypothetical protein
VKVVLMRLRHTPFRCMSDAVEPHFSLGDSPVFVRAEGPAI